MKSCGVLLMMAVVVCFAAEDPGGDPCAQADGTVDQHCRKILRAREHARKREAQCRQESNVTQEEIKDSRCSLPADPDVRERVGKYSLCASLILRQVLPNGTLAVPKGCHREAAAEATASRPPGRCEVLKRAVSCAKEKEAEVGSSPEQRAMVGRVCLCSAKRHAVLVRRCEAEEVRDEPYCVEQRRRRGGELQCRKDSGLTPRQLKDGRCKLPEDKDVKEKLAKYSSCSLLNNGQMFPNGTTKMMFAAVKCSDATLTTTETPQRNRKRQERLAFICEMKKKFSDCLQEKTADQENGTEQDKRALAHQLCKCEVAAAVAQHRRRKNETTS